MWDWAIIKTDRSWEKEVTAMGYRNTKHEKRMRQGNYGLNPLTTEFVELSIGTGGAMRSVREAVSRTWRLQRSGEPLVLCGFS